MCEYCHGGGRFGHSSGCPNAPEPAKVYECYRCHEAILETDQYVGYGGVEFHPDCFIKEAIDDIRKEAKFHEATSGCKVIRKCAYCEEEILENEQWAVYEGKSFHVECLEDHENVENLMRPYAYQGEAGDDW